MLLAQGLTDKEISDRLVISVPTGRGHKREIDEKPGVHCRTQATTKVAAFDLILRR